MPHVTSSAAIAPGCLSAQQGKERDTRRDRGLGQEQGQEKDTETWASWKKTKTRNISEAMVNPQLASLKVLQRVEGDY